MIRTRHLRLRARLDRLSISLAHLPPAPDPGPDFPVDPSLAKAIRDDQHQLDKLIPKEGFLNMGATLTPAEKEEMTRLRASIKERARGIGCPEGYGERQVRRDRRRLGSLSSKRLSPGGCLTDAEDLEEALLTARVSAFDETPERLGRRRIGDLELRKVFSQFNMFTIEALTTDEQNELDTLNKLYPPTPPDPNSVGEIMKKARSRHMTKEN